MKDKEKRKIILRFAAENKGAWPECADLLITTGSKWGACQSHVGMVYPATKDGDCVFSNLNGISNDDDECYMAEDGWIELCTRTEFEALMQELAEGAPDGATHYCIKSKLAAYWKSDSCMHFYVKEESFPSLYTFDEMNSHLIPLPKIEHEKWMPEVGRECEFFDISANYKSDWVRVTPLFFSDQVVILKHWASGNDFLMQVDEVNFRPLRTEAEKEREVLALKLFRAIAKNNTSSDDLAKTTYLYKDCLSAIDTGWRPQEKTND